MSDSHSPAGRFGVSRRHFLQGSAAAISVTIVGVPGLSRLARAQADTSAAGTPGIATQRIDGLAKVTGQKIYARDFSAADMKWKPDQWYAMFLRAVHADRPFEGVDQSAIQAELNPTLIVTADDIDPEHLKPRSMPSRDHVIDMQMHTMMQESASGTCDNDFDTSCALTYDLVVRPGNSPDFLGQAVALLLFDSIEGFRAARRAAQFRDSDFQKYTPRVAFNVDKPAQGEDFKPVTHYVRVEDGFPGQKPFSKVSYKGDDYNVAANKVGKWIDSYLQDNANGALIVEDFEADMLAMDPMFMEPEAGLAWIDQEARTMRLVLGTQSPDGDVKAITRMFTLKGAPVHFEHLELTSCYPGGGFGGRDSSPFSLMIALAAAYARHDKTGQLHPVRLQYDRFEQFQVGLKRHACKVSGTLAVRDDDDMTLEAVKMELAFDGGGRRNLSPYVASLGALCAGGSYKFPLANIHAHAFHSENVSGGSQRGFGGPQAFLAMETAIDEIAYKKGWDPIGFRLKNVLAKGGRTVVGGPVNQELRLEEMLKKVASHELWAEREAIKSDYAARGLTYGTGLAMSLQAYGTSGDGVVAAVLMDKKGRFTVQSDAVDMGNGSATTLGVVIGDILGANATQVDMGGYQLFGHTGLTTTKGYDSHWDRPDWTVKATGSSSACLTGLHQVHVVRETAKAYFNQAILPIARSFFGNAKLKPQQTQWRDGVLYLKGVSGPGLELREIAEQVHDDGLAAGAVGHAYFQDTWARGHYDTATGRTSFDLDGLAFYSARTRRFGPLRRAGIDPPGSNTYLYARYVWAPCINVIGLTVDKTTGGVRIEKSLSVLNAGRIHVEQLVSGQSQGGLAMAIGYTLLEDMPPGLAGPANGRWNLNDYHVARYRDVPLGRKAGAATKRAQELVIMPETLADNGQGRGIAEAVMCSIAPAISNAIKNATGKRFTSLPITPAKILKGLAQ